MWTFLPVTCLVSPPVGGKKSPRGRPSLPPEDGDGYAPSIPHTDWVGNKETGDRLLAKLVEVHVKPDPVHTLKLKGR